jgi:hypothetical protein
MVAGVNFVLIPENAQGEEITSKKFKDQCSLQFAYLVETIKKVIGGKEKSYTLRTPLSAWGIVQSEDEGTGEEGGTSQNGGTSESGSSQSGSNTGGSQNSGTGSVTPSAPKLTINRSGSGTSSVSANGNAVSSGSELQAGTEVSISVTPAQGTVPTATLNGSNVALTENNGVYSGSFQMPSGNATLAINSGGTSGSDGGDMN